MNFCPTLPRRIASHKLWQPEGIVDRPLVTLTAAGELLCVERWDCPDRLSGTEFYGGMLVFGFPERYREAFGELLKRRSEPLTATLPTTVVATGGIGVVLSGLDYTTLRLTEHSQILRL